MGQRARELVVGPGSYFRGSDVLFVGKINLAPSLGQVFLAFSDRVLGSV